MKTTCANFEIWWRDYGAHILVHPMGGISEIANAKNVAIKAWLAAIIHSQNYWIDDVESPEQVRFKNGRTVRLGETPEGGTRLEIGMMREWDYEAPE